MVMKENPAPSRPLMLDLARRVKWAKESSAEVTQSGLLSLSQGARDTLDGRALGLLGLYCVVWLASAFLARLSCAERYQSTSAIGSLGQPLGETCGVGGELRLVHLSPRTNQRRALMASDVTACRWLYHTT